MEIYVSRLRAKLVGSRVHPHGAGIGYRSEAGR